MDLSTGQPRPASRHWRFTGWLLAAVWLFFLNVPLGTALHQPQSWRQVLGVAALLVFGVGYVLLFQWARRLRQSLLPIPARRARVGLLLLLAVGLASIPGTGGDWLATLVYVAAAAVFLLPFREALLVVVLCALTPVLASRLVPGWEAENTIVFAVLLASFAMFGVSRLAQRNSELQAAQQEIHRLAVAEERARAARDLHDILGHSLTVVAIKAELAGRLLDVDRERAAAEIAEVEGLARAALADVRQTVGAYREVTLAGELAGARTALAAAGIAAELPGEVPALPKEWDRLFGWAVREGVTNVVRHSGARCCTIRVHPDRVEVSDDGRGPSTSDSSGHGLVGLRERARVLDAVVSVGRRPDGTGFLLRVHAPAEAR
ncbi:two-component system, NarL family, sensor histidine kinase DesK [Micromonospora coriariae]|uniref:Two-component system, NarL family, sensor histidine kinase DesK n=1 Tax=Micromonospora coriariae TaxID=285665 RepID=A0A1C4WQS3_9ACTN|nr:histidine kinase [Micromonospora coriariae]SCE98636.1 two-component system, NarL family, sensor histidine kinase DesK [Micromonospora coriariae]